MENGDTVWKGDGPPEELMGPLPVERPVEGVFSTDVNPPATEMKPSPGAEVEGWNAGAAGFKADEPIDVGAVVKRP